MATLSNNCVVCSSKHLQVLPAAVMDFVADRMFGYPAGQIALRGVNFRALLMSRTIKCRRCGFVFCQLRPSMDEMAQYYEGYGTDAWIHARAKYEPEYLDMLQKGGPSANTRFQSKFLAIQKFLQYTPLPNKGRLLDFGGGSGDAIAPIFSSFEKYSFDIAGLPVVEGCTSVTSLENLEAFDVVLCQEVLEHVPSPNDILTDISNVLKPHSYLFITVPLEVADNLSDLSEGLVFHEHINKFTSESLSTLQRKNGFIIEKLAVCEFEIFGQSNTSIFSLARLSY